MDVIAEPCTRTRSILGGKLESPDIRLREVAALEEERLTQHLGEGVREAVAVVERGGVTSLAETAEGGARFDALPRVLCYA